MEEIIKECDNCKYVMTDTESFPCNRCTRNAVDKWEPIPKQTNADRIRSMTDEEMAEFASHYISCGYCDARQPYGNCGKTCKERLLKWLQSEAE